jgi:hypothetical protein
MQVILGACLRVAGPSGISPCAFPVPLQSLQEVHKTLAKMAGAGQVIIEFSEQLTIQSYSWANPALPEEDPSSYKEALKLLLLKWG